ncbi:MAG: DUF3761 domain-containing protein [Myxococcaceae bacterium]
MNKSAAAPAKAAAPAAAPAAAEAASVTCKDGTTSKGGKGACSGHGGIDKSAGSTAKAAAPAAPAAAAPAPPAAPAAAAPAAAGAPSTKTTGPNSDPTGAIAKCKDGTYSHSKHHEGACSSHGGVATWLDNQ